MRKGFFTVFVAMFVMLVASACAAPSGLPPAKEGTLLRKIQDRGRLIVGVKYDVPTFGYLNPKTNTLEGFDPAVAREIAAYIFGDPNKVEFKEAVTKNRIPFLKDGTVDVILSTFTINEDRLKEVDFSIVYYVSGDRMLVPLDSTIRTIADLDGRKVAANRGSGVVDRLTKQTKAEIVLVNNASEALQTVLNRQADVMTGDDIAMFGLAISNPGLKIVGPPISIEPLGAGVAKGNPELLEVVNTVIKNLKSSGKWKTIWKAEIGDKLGIATIPEPPDDDWRINSTALP